MKTHIFTDAQLSGMSEKVFKEHQREKLNINWMFKEKVLFIPAQGRYSKDNALPILRTKTVSNYSRQ